VAGINHSNIQSLVDSANEGDVLEVPTGRYNESVVVNKRNLNLTVEEGGKCILDGERERDAAFTVVEKGVSLNGFVIKNYDVGVKILAPRTTIDYIKLENNNVDFVTATYDSVSISNCESSKLIKRR
jgi:hypothetical protein